MSSMNYFSGQNALVKAETIRCLNEVIKKINNNEIKIDELTVTYDFQKKFQGIKFTRVEFLFIDSPQSPNAPHI